MFRAKNVGVLTVCAVMTLVGSAFPAPARAGEPKHPTLKQNMKWFSPCSCLLTAGTAQVADAKATLAWAKDKQPANPVKMGTGGFLRLETTRSYSVKVTPPDDWALSETQRKWTPEWQASGEGVSNVTGQMEVPENVAVFQFKKPGEFTVKVKYKCVETRTYDAPKRKRTEPQATCGGGPCPKAGAAVPNEEVVTSQATSNELTVRVIVQGFKLAARRMGGGDGFGQQATLAAGRIGTPVHTAELEVKLEPAGDPGESISADIVMTGNWDGLALEDVPVLLNAHDGKALPMTWLEEGGTRKLVGSLKATTEGWACRHEAGSHTDENGNEVKTYDYCYYRLLSARKVGSCTISSETPDVEPVTFQFKWSDLGNEAGLTGAKEFKPCTWEDVNAKLSFGGMPIDSHIIDYVPKSAKAHFWISTKDATDPETNESYSIEGYWAKYDVLSSEITYPEGDSISDAEKLAWYTAFSVPTGKGNTTDQSGTAYRQQKCFANDYYVTESVTFEAVDTAVIK